MTVPSGFRPSGSDPIQTREVARGQYVAINAYDGPFDYFRGMPAPATDSSTVDESPGLPGRQNGADAESE
jgi:hypothetical protein